LAQLLVDLLLLLPKQLSFAEALVALAQVLAGALEVGAVEHHRSCMYAERLQQCSLAMHCVVYYAVTQHAQHVRRRGFHCCYCYCPRQRSTTQAVQANSQQRLQHLLLLLHARCYCSWFWRQQGMPVAAVTLHLLQLLPLQQPSLTQPVQD
jgi:hypothetical protein